MLSMWRLVDLYFLPSSTVLQYVVVFWGWWRAGDSSKTFGGCLEISAGGGPKFITLHRSRVCKSAVKREALSDQSSCDHTYLRQRYFFGFGFGTWLYVGRSQPDISQAYCHTLRHLTSICSLFVIQAICIVTKCANSFFVPTPRLHTRPFCCSPSCIEFFGIDDHSSKRYFHRQRLPRLLQLARKCYEDILLIWPDACGGARWKIWKFKTLFHVTISRLINSLARHATLNGVSGTSLWFAFFI